MRLQTSAIILSTLSLSLASCASVPRQDQLLTGIDATTLAADAQGETVALQASNPVCVDFYDNVNTFQAEAQKSQGGKNFMSSLGLNVVAAVVTQGLIPPGLSSAGRVAASTAASSITSQGSEIAIRELNSSDRADAIIIETASQIGCPVNIAAP